MFLSKLLLKEYGQFYNRQVELKDGVNLVYDNNREKRRSFKDFIVSMLYGSSGWNSLGIGEDIYSKRKPVSDYKGAAYIKADDTTYLVERSFAGGSRSTTVLNITEGKQDDYLGMVDLPENMVPIDRNNYITSCVIDDQSRSDEEGTPDSEYDEKTKKFIRNTIETGCADINFDDSIEYLRNIRNKKSSQPMVRRLNELSKQIDSYDYVDGEIDETEKKIKNLDEEFAIEAAKRKRVARKMVQEEDGTVKYEVDEELNKKMDILAESGQDMLKNEEEKPEKKITDSLPVILGTGLLVIIAIAIIVYILPFESLVKKLFIIFTVVFVIFTIVDGLRINGFFDSGDMTPSEEDFKQVLKEIEDEKDEREAIEFDMTFAKEYASNKENLRKEVGGLLQKRYEKNKLQAEFNAVFKKKSELETENYAITAAMNQLIKEREKIMTENLPKVKRHISDHVSEVTDGRYDSILFDKDYNVSVSRGGELRDMKDLSDHEKRLVYVAARLGIAEAFGLADIPIIMEDMLDDFDTDMINSVLRCISNMKSKQQIIITSDAQLGNKLANTGLSFNFVQI